MLLRQSRMAVHVVRAVHRGTALAATSSRLGLHQRAYAAQLHRLIAQSVRFAATDRSKVEYTLKMLRDDIQRQQEEESRKLKLVPAGKGVPVVKPSIYRRVVDELKHYYHGFRLLALETRLSSRYVWRVVRGSSLTRRERQQLVRTVADIFRLVPFSVFVIVPFMEFTLPIFLKLFPGMLPSTFQEASKEQEKIRTQLKAKMEMAKFLQDTIEEIALEKKDAKKDGEKGGQALEFAHFIKKVRTEGGYVSNADLLRFSKLFEDELTLDSLSMSQLRALCRLVNVQPLGTPEILRFQLNLKLRELKADDKQIALEGGVDVLSTSDLQAACRARGMRSLGLSEDRLQEQLRQWLELSLRDDVPPSFLLLSRTLYLPEDVTFTDRLKALVSSMPESIAEQTRQKLTEIEGGKVNYKERLELIKNIEAAIKDERTKAADVEKREVEAKKLKEEKEAAAKEGVVLSSTMEKKATTAEKLIDKVHEVVDKAHARVEELKAETVALATDKTLKKDLAKKDVKTEPKLDPKDLKQIEDILHGSTAAEAKHDILGLKEKVIEHTEDLIEVGALDGAFAETKIAKRLRTKLNSMIENVDQLVNKLEVTKRSVDESIADPAIPDAAKIKKAQQVRIADLINTLHGIKAATDDEGRTKRIEELLNALDQDHDGVIDKQLGIEVIDLLTKHADVPLGASQLANIVETLKKEDDAEAMSRAFDENPLVNPIQPQGPQLSPKAAEKAAEAAAQKSLPEPPLDVPEVSTPTAPLQQKSPQKPPEHPKL